MELSAIIDVLLLQDYNTRLVVICVILLGAACGVMGSFLLLRKRSLMGDTLSHATLPGVAVAFILAVQFGGDGKSLWVLLLGAAISGVLGCLTVLWIRNYSRIKDDAAMGIVLSVFFGFGVVLLGFIQRMPEASAAGLESFIYGKTASMVMSDFRLLACVATGVICVSVLLFKEFKLLCFDEAYATSLGFPVWFLDILLFALVTLVTVSGLQAVGLILIIAFLITPAAAARFWTDRLEYMVVLSALIGGLSGWLGASMSALVPGLPAGALIVLVAAGCFLLSLIFGRQRGVLLRLRNQYLLKRKVGRQHLLRAVYEILESEADADGDVFLKQPVPFRQIRGRRTWQDVQLRRYIRQAYQAALLEVDVDKDTVRLTEAGLEAAAQVTRNHRLWEIYLIEHAEVAASRVDRDADAIEHVLGGDLVASLETKLLAFQNAERMAVPASPHPIQPGD